MLATETLAALVALLALMELGTTLPAWLIAPIGGVKLKSSEPLSCPMGSNCGDGIDKLKVSAMPFKAAVSSLANKVEQGPVLEARHCESNGAKTMAP